MNTKYFVITKETIKETCFYCNGKGKVEEKQYHNRYEIVKCPICNGKGVRKKTIKTEVELETALKELTKNDRLQNQTPL